MATFQTRGDTVRCIIRRAGFKPRSQSFPNMTDAKAWARENDREAALEPKAAERHGDERGLFVDRGGHVLEADAPVDGPHDSHVPPALSEADQVVERAAEMEIVGHDVGAGAFAQQGVGDDPLSGLQNTGETQSNSSITRSSARSSTSPGITAGAA